MLGAVQACSFFLKYGNCKFRSKCYYSHPNIAPRSGPRAGQILINDDQQPTLDEAVRDRPVRHSERNNSSVNDRDKGRDWGVWEGRFSGTGVSPKRGRGHDRDRDRDRDGDEASELGDGREVRDARDGREGRDRDRDRDRRRDRPRFAAGTAAANSERSRSRSRSRSPAPTPAAQQRIGSFGRLGSSSPPPSRPDRGHATHSRGAAYEAEAQRPSRCRRSPSRSRSLSRSRSPSHSRSPSIDRLIRRVSAASSPRRRGSELGRSVAAPRTVEPPTESFKAYRSVGGLRGSGDDSAAQQPSVQDRQAGGKSTEGKGSQGGKHAAACMFQRSLPSPAPMERKRKAPDWSEEPNSAAPNLQKRDKQNPAKARAAPDAMERPAKAGRMFGLQFSDDAEDPLQGAQPQTERERPWRRSRNSSEMLSDREKEASEAAADQPPLPKGRLQTSAQRTASNSENDDRGGRWAEKSDKSIAAPTGAVLPPPPPRSPNDMDAPVAHSSAADVLGGVRGKAAGSDRVTTATRGTGAAHNNSIREQPAVPAVQSTEHQKSHAPSFAATTAHKPASASNHAAAPAVINGCMPVTAEPPRTTAGLVEGQIAGDSEPLGPVKRTPSVAAAESGAALPVATPSGGGRRWDRGPGGAVVPPPSTTSNPPLPPQSTAHNALVCLRDNTRAVVPATAPDSRYPLEPGCVHDNAATTAVSMRLQDTLAQVPPLPEVAWLPEASRSELKQLWESYCNTAHAQFRTAAMAVLKLTELSSQEQQALADVQVCNSL